MTTLPIPLSVRIEKAISQAEENIAVASEAAHKLVMEQPSIAEALANIITAEARFDLTREEAESLRDLILKSGPTSDAYRKYVKEFHTQVYNSQNMQMAVNVVQAAATAELISAMDADAILKRISRHGVSRIGNGTPGSGQTRIAPGLGRSSWMRRRKKTVIGVVAGLALAVYLATPSVKPRERVIQQTAINDTAAQDMFAKGQLVKTVAPLEIGSGASAISIETGSVFQLDGRTCQNGHTGRDTTGAVSKPICIPDTVVRSYP